MSDFDAEIYNKIDDILYFDWNPIGATDLPRDEFKSYTSGIFSLKKRGVGIEEIAQALLALERDYFGEYGNIEHCRLVAKKIGGLSNI